MATSTLLVGAAAVALTTRRRSYSDWQSAHDVTGVGVAWWQRRDAGVAALPYLSTTMQPCGGGGGGAARGVVAVVKSPTLCVSSAVVWMNGEHVSINDVRRVV